jgi:hypothetical protein
MNGVEQGEVGREISDGATAVTTGRVPTRDDEETRERFERREGRNLQRARLGGNAHETGVRTGDAYMPFAASQVRVATAANVFHAISVGVTGVW